MARITEYSASQDNVTFSKVLGGNAVDQRWTVGDISTSLNTQKIINAVQIDWNGADWESIPTGQETPSEINTTADLLKAIKYASEVGGTTEVSGTDTTGITVPVFLTALAF